MSAMIELERIVVDRRIMRALHTVLQSQRASLLEKQEAEFALMKHQHLELKDIANSAEEEEVAMKRRINELENLVRELVDNYWTLINDCIGWFTKEYYSRGQKRELPSTEQFKKLEKIISEHNGKRARMVVNASTGSSTDR